MGNPELKRIGRVLSAAMIDAMAANDDEAAIDGLDDLRTQGYRIKLALAAEARQHKILMEQAAAAAITQYVNPVFPEQYGE